MDVSGAHETDISMPTSVSYGSIHESPKLKMLTTNSGMQEDIGVGRGTGNGGLPSGEDFVRPPEANVKKTVRYRECLKNHAASMGGHAVDGCGEFMPNGEEGSLEALKCAACNCHRNFHRREVEGEPPCYNCYSPCNDRRRLTPMALPPSAPLALPSSPAVARPPHPMIMPLGSALSEPEEQEIVFPHASLPYASLHHASMPLTGMKKRFRTKFTTEQKEKMSEFAEKLGWRIQKHDEATVQQFCVDVGVKRHVLKVWMHNNKHTVGKKLFSYSEPLQPGSETT